MTDSDFIFKLQKLANTGDELAIETLRRFEQLQKQIDYMEGALEYHTQQY